MRRFGVRIPARSLREGKPIAWAMGFFVYKNLKLAWKVFYTRKNTPTVVGGFPSRNSERKGSFDRRENNPYFFSMMSPRQGLMIPAKLSSGCSRCWLMTSFQDSIEYSVLNYGLKLAWKEFRIRKNKPTSVGGFPSRNYDHSTERRIIPQWPHRKLAISVPLVLKTVTDMGQLLNFRNSVRLAIELSLSPTDFYIKQSRE